MGAVLQCPKTTSIKKGDLRQNPWQGHTPTHLKCTTQAQGIQGREGVGVIHQWLMHTDIAVSSLKRPSDDACGMGLGAL